MDLDRVASAAPEVDLGEFLVALGRVARRERIHDAPAHRARLAFMKGYLGEDTARGTRVTSGGLAFHWSCRLVAKLFGLIEAGHPKLDERVESYRAELAAVPGRAAELTSRAVAVE